MRFSEFGKVRRSDAVRWPNEDEARKANKGARQKMFEPVFHAPEGKWFDLNLEWVLRPSNDFVTHH